MIRMTVSGTTREELLDALASAVAMLSGADDAPEAKQPDTPKKAKAPAKASGRRKSAASADDGPTRDEVRDAIQTSIDTHGEAPMKEVFKKHKAKKFSDIKDSQLAAVLADIKQIDELAGEDGDDDGFDLD